MTLLTTLHGQTEQDAWRPTVSQVAAILRARTRGPESMDASTAGEQGMFTDTTRPTYAQVEEDIQLAVDEMSGLVHGRVPCTDGLAGAFRTAALYRAAQLVETSYFPEQTNADQTAFKALAEMWKDASKSAAAAIIEHCPLTGDDGSSDVEGGPIGCVPVGRPMTRWCEKW